ncbi:MAG TPA: flagellar basal body L-ring protein FlgH [Acidocella sp.]|nr:flagellar basal body L-ring protein FlgH [Acidocella sp.]
MRARLRRALAVLALPVLAGCATHEPTQTQLVKPAPFPVVVEPQPNAVNGSVYPASTAGSLYAPRRDWKVGDLVTIEIVTSSSASNTDNAALKRTGTINDSMTTFMGIPMSFGHINGGSLSPTITASSDQQFAGTGSDVAANDITGAVEAVVTNVDPNGTLALQGRTNVNINGNVTSIVVTGYASPDDIAANAAISSDNIANMNVQYVGNGPINDAHTVPWLQRALSKVWPF